MIGRVGRTLDACFVKAANIAVVKAGLGLLTALIDRDFVPTIGIVFLMHYQIMPFKLFHIYTEFHPR